MAMCDLVIKEDLKVKGTFNSGVDYVGEEMLQRMLSGSQLAHLVGHRVGQ